MSELKDLNRRDFLSTGTGMAALGAASLVTKPARAMAANDRVQVAICGVHGRGKDHLHNYSQIPKAQIAALCDIDENVLRERLADMEKMGLPKPATYTDIRKLLEDKSIDAISIATPNHWHTLMAIWACQAGKDVYVEKPCSHNLWEGKQLVKAAQRYNRVVQHGTQIRSSTAIRDAVQKLRGDAVGETYMARGLCYKWRDTIGRAPVEPVPAGVDYDLWTGPAPKHEFTKNRFHYNWHWNWLYGNGDFGNQGIHEVDICRWGIGVRYPSKISAIGGHLMFDDDQETPNTLTATYEFNEGGRKRMMVFEVRHWMSNHEAGIGEGGKKKDSNSIGNLFYGSKGYMAVDGYNTYKTWMGRDQ